MATIEVTVRHSDNGKGVKEYAESQAERLVKRFPKTESVKAVIDKQRHQYSAEFVIQVKGQTAVGATQLADNAASAIDTAAAKAERQIRKQRNKVVSVHTRTTAKK
ncbi:MAG: HPF/RaiA family ribosome-associated protein [Kiritimatiellae bacterium]|nr:HPF/RaiA family ribosome-associated protein [Kiritimatiellia bacterium]